MKVDLHVVHSVRSGRSVIHDIFFTKAKAEKFLSERKLSHGEITPWSIDLPLEWWKRRMRELGYRRPWVPDGQKRRARLQ